MRSTPRRGHARARDRICARARAAPARTRSAASRSGCGSRHRAARIRQRPASSPSIRPPLETTIARCPPRSRMRVKIDRAGVRGAGVQRRHDDKRRERPEGHDLAARPWPGKWFDLIRSGVERQTRRSRSRIHSADLIVMRRLPPSPRIGGRDERSPSPRDLIVRIARQRNRPGRHSPFSRRTGRRTDRPPTRRCATA